MRLGRKLTLIQKYRYHPNFEKKINPKSTEMKILVLFTKI